MGHKGFRSSVDFLSVGPQRTGTTWLYEMLQQHPELYLPRTVKETMFFDRHYERGVEWYARYFENSREGQLCGEVAPTYFDDPAVPERVYDIASDCTIIINLRHPAERAFSLYIHHLRKGRVPKSFQDAVEQKPQIITSGHYATHIPRWQSVFGKDKVHFVFHNDIRVDSEKTLDQIFRWIGVQPIEDPACSDEKVNAASMPRFPFLAKVAATLTTKLHEHGLHNVVNLGKRLGIHTLAYTGGEDSMPQLSESERSRLLREYGDDIEFVESTTGRDLSHWRK